MAPPVTAAPATSCKLGSRVTIPYNYENGAKVLCFAHVYDPTQTADGDIAIIWDEHFWKSGDAEIVVERVPVSWVTLSDPCKEFKVGDSVAVFYNGMKHSHFLSDKGWYPGVIEKVNRQSNRGKYGPFEGLLSYDIEYEDGCEKKVFGEYI